METSLSDQATAPPPEFTINSAPLSTEPRNLVSSNVVSDIVLVPLYTVLACIVCQALSLSILSSTFFRMLELLYGPGHKKKREHHEEIKS